MGEDVETNLGHGWYDRPRRHPREGIYETAGTGAGDFSGEKCCSGDATEVIRDKESGGADGKKSQEGTVRVCEG